MRTSRSCAAAGAVRSHGASLAPTEPGCRRSRNQVLYEGGPSVKLVSGWAGGGGLSGAHFSIAPSVGGSGDGVLAGGGAFHVGPSRRPEPGRRLPGRRVGCG